MADTVISLDSKQKQNRRLPAEMNPAELNDLFAECMPRLQKAARRMFRNQEDSEDALQEALLLAFRKVHQFQGRSSFSTWMHTIVRNTSCAYYRKATAHPTVSTDHLNSSEEGIPEEQAFVDERPMLDERYALNERSEIFRRAARELPKKYQPAIYLFYLRGLGEEATAEALGITVSALKTRLHRSRLLLSWRIRKNCLSKAKRALFCARPTFHGNSRARDWNTRCCRNESSKH